MDYRNQSLGALAIAIPRASRLFRQHQLDFCCGGRQSLARAAERKGLDIDQLENALAALAATPEQSRDWRTAPLGEVIVFGMPREAIAGGGVSEVVELDRMSQRMLAQIAGGQALRI